MLNDVPHTYTLDNGLQSGSQLRQGSRDRSHHNLQDKRTNTHRVAAVHWTHTQWIKETHLDKWDSRYWGEEQLGFYRGGCTAPSHSERDPPGERREQY